MPQLDQSTVIAAAQCLREGGLVAFPTETVYGLGANALIGRSVARVFAAKGRPSFNPLIVHLANASSVEALCDMPEDARRLAEAFWPGPLTLVLQRKASCRVSELVSAGLSTLAVRVPAHPVARALLGAAGVPVAAPSANTSGRLSATNADHVREDLGERVDLVLDGGATLIGVESTVVAFGEKGGGGNDKYKGGEKGNVVVLRAGGIETAALEEVLGRSVQQLVELEGAALRSPGQLSSHYAPRAEIRLNALNVVAGEALLAFGARIPEHEGPALNLSARGDLAEAAANLFSHLRKLDALGVHCIAVMPVPTAGLGEAINDRLARASAPRPRMKSK